MIKKPLAFFLGFLLALSFLLGSFLIPTNARVQDIEGTTGNPTDAHAQKVQNLGEGESVVIHTECGMKPRENPPPQNGDMTW